MAIKRMSTLFILLLVMSINLASFEALAQSTPQDPAFAGIPVTFDKDDILKAMTTDEREDFLEMREKLKQLKKAKNSKGIDPAVREASEIYYQTTAEKFEKDFGIYRGFNGKTVMVYGHPSPTKGEIIARILDGSYPGGKGMLQHWKREDSGAVVGLNSKPTFETSPYLAGDEVRAKVKIEPGMDRPRPSTPGLPPAQHCRKKAGPPSSPGLKCKCNPPSQQLFGMPSCGWYK